MNKETFGTMLTAEINERKKMGMHSLLISLWSKSVRVDFDQWLTEKNQQKAAMGYTETAIRPIWDTPIGEEWMSIVEGDWYCTRCGIAEIELEEFTCKGCKKDMLRSQEKDYIERTDAQDLAMIALQAVVYALKRADVALQDVGIDDESIKGTVLEYEQKVKDTQRLSIIF